MTERQTDIKAFNSKNDGVRHKRKNGREGGRERVIFVGRLGFAL